MLRRFSFLIMLGLMLALASCATPPARTPTSTVGIKAGRTVAVQAGETLYSFARRNNASMREIIDLNRMPAPYTLTGVSTLKLPATDADLPSVELGPIAAQNENEYKQKHKGKPTTTYTQVAPEVITEAKAQELAEDRAPSPQLAAPTSDLQNEANSQFTQPTKQEKFSNNVTEVTAATSALKLKPMHFDKKHKQLAEIPKPVNAVKVSVPEKTLPKAAPEKLTKTTKPARVKPDPNDIDIPTRDTAKVIPPELKAPVSEEKPEQQDAVIEQPKTAAPVKPAREMHSRIEKKAEPINLIWPVQGTVVSTYGPKSNGLKNDGINIAVPRGTPVVAADGGTVAYAGSDIPGYGNVVLVRHPNGLMTTYAHLERMFVQQDIVVAKGDLVGTVGSTGGVDTPQLHFEIRRDKEALDPSKYLYR